MEECLNSINPVMENGTSPGILLVSSSEEDIERSVKDVMSNAFERDNSDVELGGRPKKFPFILREETNGHMLIFHHTIKDKNKLMTIKIATFCFNARSTIFTVIDKRGNIFVFDFNARKYWRLRVKVLRASTIIQSQKRANEYLIGTKLGVVMLLDLDQECIIKTLELSVEPVIQLTFPDQATKSSNTCFVHAGHKAFLMNVDTFTPTHRLDFDEVHNSLKFACFMPNGEQFFTCFTNDTMHVWSAVTLNTLKVIHPLKTRDRKLKLIKKEDIMEIGLDKECGETEFIPPPLFDHSDGIISDCAFTPDGCNLWLSTLDGYLLHINAYTYELQKIIRLKDFVARKCVIFPIVNHTLLFAITTEHKVVLIDCQKEELNVTVMADNVCDMRITADGKMLATLTHWGEVYIWNAFKVHSNFKRQMTCTEILISALRKSKPIAPSYEHGFYEDMRKLLQRDRLQAILKEFGCYPAKYRHLIWSSLLQLPGNAAQFQELLKCGIPDVVNKRTMALRIKAGNKRAMIKTWSCLSHWCKVMLYSEFLPYLMHPFLQIFPRNALMTFELLMTLLLNHFQLCFEFHPLEPINYLGMCSNILHFFDKKLAAFYVERNIEAKHYAWSLLANAFSEVLDEDQWYRLWDNVVTHPPYFLIFCTVAYNILHRDILFRIVDTDTIVYFFHEQSPINVAKLVAKAVHLMDKCPVDIHPKRYIADFKAIPKRVYPKFVNYPRERVQQYEDEMAGIKQEQAMIDGRLHELELEERKMKERLTKALQEEEYAKRLQEMEARYKNAIQREEERIACDRKVLLLCQKEMSNRKSEAIATIKESDQRRKALLVEGELDTLLSCLERERLRLNSDLLFAESKLHNQEVETLWKNTRTTTAPVLGEIYSDEREKLQREKQSLYDSIKKVTDLGQKQQQHGHPCDSGTNLKEIENKFEEIRSEFYKILEKK